MSTGIGDASDGGLAVRFRCDDLALSGPMCDEVAPRRASEMGWVIPSSSPKRVVNPTTRLSCTRALPSGVHEGVKAAADPALEALVHRWRLPLFLIAAAQLSEIEEAEDVVQTVLLRVVRRRSLEDVEDAGAYLRTAVRNQCRTVLTRRRPLRTLPDEVDPPEASHSPPADVNEIRGLLRDAIRTLPRWCRVAMWLVYVEGVRPAEAAQLLGQSPNTTKSSLARGRRLLRQRLGPVLRRAGYLEV